MRTALITGASRGIGAAIATALAPMHTLLLAGRPSPALQATAERLGATALPLDLTDTDAIPSATNAIGELDALVHNAGIFLPGPSPSPPSMSGVPLSTSMLLVQWLLRSRCCQRYGARGAR